MANQRSSEFPLTRNLKVVSWTSLCVVLLTVAQYGSVHLLSGRPSSWLFEASLDLAPALLFAGDIAQLTYTEGSQALLRDQMQAIVVGVLFNITIYSVIAIVVTHLFFPRRRPNTAN